MIAITHTSWAKNRMYVFAELTIHGSLCQAAPATVVHYAASSSSSFTVHPCCHTRAHTIGHPIGIQNLARSETNPRPIMDNGCGSAQSTSGPSFVTKSLQCAVLAQR